ncbi:hypothetical protein [Demequina sp. NBRC 110056]|uniref:hypothetical protein n=1 Tax=Demequina sp. NBRC 110056 TaxID=1570345 RepID=UPI000A000BF4|nr:hypothetical protein [Demequina sp. NBRC 110056]
MSAGEQPVMPAERPSRAPLWALVLLVAGAAVFVWLAPVLAPSGGSGTLGLVTVLVLGLGTAGVALAVVLVALARGRAGSGAAPAIALTTSIVWLVLAGVLIVLLLAE